MKEFRTTHKKLLSLLLVIIMFVSIAPMNMFSVTASATQMTLGELKEKYPHEKYWNHVGLSYNNPNGWTNTPCSSHSSTSTCNGFVYNGVTLGWQCFGFALQLGYDAYGSNPKDWGRAYDLNNIKPGDIINYDGDNPGHTVFVIDVDGDVVTFAECNFGGRCIIKWGRSLKKNQFNNLFNVYVAPYELDTSEEHVCSFDWNDTRYEGDHPHRVYVKCSCGKTQYTGATTTVSSCSQCVHTCSFDWNNKSYEGDHPHRMYVTCSCGKTQYTGETTSYIYCDICMNITTKLPTSIYSYLWSMGDIDLHSNTSGLFVEDTIKSTDLCKITEMYDCGWCKVTYYSDSGETKTGYVKTDEFFNLDYTDLDYTEYKVIAAESMVVYGKRNLSGLTIGGLAPGDAFYIIGFSDPAVQILYPVSDGYEVGWISKYMVEYTISYNANGGKGAMDDSSAIYDWWFNLSSNKFTRDGYTFDSWNVYRESDKKWYCLGHGWETDEELRKNDCEKATYRDNFSAILNFSWINGSQTNDTLTFYAKWVPNSYRVSFFTEEGEVSLQKKDVTYGSCYGELPIPTRDNYTFKGWYTLPNNGTRITKDSIVSIAEDHTVYAQWEPNSYTVTYNANGGSGAPSADKKLFGIDYTVTSVCPVRDGYSFNGWNTKADGTGVWYAPNSKYTVNGDVTFYAQWKENEKIGYVTCGFVSFNTNANNEIIIDFIRQGESVPTEQMSFSGESFNQTIGIEYGNYTMRVSKENHVTREYNVTIGDETVNLDIQLNLIGDINGDGKINVMDYSSVLRHAKKTENLEDYAFLCADVDGNGRVTVSDYARILRHVKKTDPLW